MTWIRIHVFKKRIQDSDPDPDPKHGSNDIG